MAASLVFITGGSGFIGSQVVQDTLKAGHRVRVSVRREAQAEQLKERFAPYTNEQDQLEFVVIPDLTDSAVIRSALGEDVSYIFHLASPLPGRGTDFKAEYLGPAVKATEAVLVAAATAKAVKRVVVMSSLLALMPLDGLRIPGLVINEGANASIQVDEDMVFPEGPRSDGAKYSASKILAHRFTIEWATQNKPHFALVTLHPTFVVGYDQTQKSAASPGALVNSWILASLASGSPAIPAGFVDVRDVSQAHLNGMDAPLNPDAPLTEVILAGPKTSWEGIVKFVKANYPAIPCTMSEEGPYQQPFIADSSRAEGDFGIKWHTMDETISSFLDQQLQFNERAGL
ncbi:hypothetical protein B0H66DRAFT_212905 [Apodospora peruviana]|uniref:NAD-dependent epimerase/dehydratase domain-containing protein n=1 Tax=Apodospora peruviana TaxID=516989 RepID=A0AAE0ICZ2_9PEZI|nr:hypothetical protein B0H66DRAFT_212905 [Apodospora peruviana]